MRVRGIAVLAVLAVLSLAVWWAFWPRPAGKTGRTRLLDGIPREAVTTIEMHYPGGVEVLRRQGERWVLPRWRDYRADPGYVRFLLDTLWTMSAGDIVARDAGKWARFRLAEEDGKTLVLKDAADVALARIQVGKAGPGARTVYFRYNGEVAVRVAVADLVPAVSRPVWGDRTPWRVKPEHISEVRLKGFPVSWHARKQEGAWRIVDRDDIRLTAAFAEKLLPRLAHFRAAHVTFEPEAHGGEEEAVLAVAASTAVFTAAFTRAEDGSWRARLPGEPVVYHFPAALTDLFERAVTEPR